MGTDEKKLIRIFTRQGGQYGILTRMPFKEIDEELYETSGPRDPSWVIFEALNAADERVFARVRREDISVAMVEKKLPDPPASESPSPSRIQIPDLKKL